MIETDKLREFLREGQLRFSSLKDGTHYEGCEYDHWPCAILRLCKELDEARAASGQWKTIEIMLTDGFGNYWARKCHRCGAEMVVIRPGEARCSEECYLRDEEDQDEKTF